MHQKQKYFKQDQIQ